MTLKDQMIADMDAVFMNTDDFAVDLELRPGGDGNRSVPFVGVISEDNEMGTFQVDGDGVKPETNHGERMRLSADLECAVTVNIALDDFVYEPATGRLWAVRKEKKRDVAGQTWRIVRVTKVSTKAIRPRY